MSALGNHVIKGIVIKSGNSRDPTRAAHGRSTEVNNRGVLAVNQETATVVAVKVLDLQRRESFKNFTAEFKTLSSIQHPSLVKILTSCSSVDFNGNEFKALVFEFMPNGSLENRLHPVTFDDRLQSLTRRSLSFEERLNVAIDVAYALDYLHHHKQTPIVHCNLKPSNILFDNDMNGHVGDFGLAKFLGEVTTNVESEDHNIGTSVRINGSIGYAAPGTKVFSIPNNFA
ncbi:probable LRR receptor-like serine/threonine-protein kinase At3g47570 [Papaver somniferum]|uniref:probable LRR receptor-like serine/threonine-protein kinase At3g47570 n=1 Tax=Papaver somniferum TaxID=3469 RepID=UPI000E7026F3|nr:probable LRR receptor-like serine/threonine-protein kinase At3g47570 [Papaver somniferum]